MTDLPPRMIFCAPVTTALRETLSDPDQSGFGRLFGDDSLPVSVSRPSQHRKVAATGKAGDACGLTDVRALLVGDERVERAHHACMLRDGVGGTKTKSDTRCGCPKRRVAWPRNSTIHPSSRCQVQVIVLFHLHFSCFIYLHHISDLYSLSGHLAMAPEINGSSNDHAGPSSPAETTEKVMTRLAQSFPDRESLSTYFPSAGHDAERCSILSRSTSADPGATATRDTRREG
jgi:hypothetical protein